MHINIFQTLFKKLHSTAPIESITIGRIDDKGTWSISYKPDATVDQRAAAQAIINQFDLALEEIAQQRIDARQVAAKVSAKNIPNWALWTQAQLQTWWDNNLADSIVDGFSIPVGVKNMLKSINGAILRIAQLLIAMRDSIWPDLPDVP